MNLTATTGGVFVNLTSGNLATSQITNLSTATGQTVALSTGSGAITVDNVAGFGANIASDNLQLTTAGPAEGITLDTSSTAGTRHADRRGDHRFQRQRQHDRRTQLADRRQPGL